MEPLRFISTDARDLFGLLHAPDGAGNGKAILMLPPFGQEAVRAHRLSRVLADRMARQGAWVLRFDYYGSGDSGGDDLDADLAGWQFDVRAAHQQLRAASGCRDLRWLGLRLGFTVGLLALASAPANFDTPPGVLVGWDPVLDGPDYLRELRAGHAAALRTSYSLPTVPEREIARLAGQARLDEALGFGLSAGFVEQIDALRPGLLPRPDGVDIAVVSSRRPASGARGSTREAASAGSATSASLAPFAGIGSETVDVDFDWVSEEALNTPLVPDPLLRRLMARLGLERSTGRAAA